MAFFKNKKKTDEKKAATPKKVTPGSSFFSIQNPKILEVNLIKDEAQVSFDWAKNLLMLGLALVIGVILIGEVYYALSKWEEKEGLLLAGITAETDKLNAETVKLRNDSADALSYKEKALVFSELLDNHVYWSGFLSFIEKNTLSSVRYSEFGGDLSGSYGLNATASTFSEVAWQANMFMQDPLVKQVKVRQANKGIIDEEDLVEGEEEIVPEIVQFGLMLDLRPEIFKK